MTEEGSSISGSDLPGLDEEADRIRSELNPSITRPTVVVVMGVTSSGKTTAGKLLADVMGWFYQEGDLLHSAANVEKMRHGTPLTDEDRAPWLRSIATKIDGWRAAGQSGVLTCSALKRRYRDIIIGNRPDVALVYMKGPHDLIVHRMEGRHGHYMPIALVDSQFDALEEPTPDEHPIVVSIDGTPHDIVSEILRRLIAASPAV